MAKAPSTGPRWIRALIFALSVLLFCFYTWLLLFIVNDIDRLPGPDYSQLQDRFVGKPLVERRSAISSELTAVDRQIANGRETQELLQRSTASSQATLSQLIELHRASVERGVKPGEAEQAAFVESESLFLANQQKYQQANEEIAQLTKRRQELQHELETIGNQINEASLPAQAEYARQSVRHGYKQAALKLAFLVPVLLLAAWLTIRKAGSVYRPMVFPLLPAALLLTGMVMHEHFPSKLFKYIAISFGIFVVLLLLVRLIRVVVAPRGEWLLSRYREAYNRLRCPICEQPIRRGVLRQVLLTPNGPIEIAAGDGQRDGAIESYNCPACGTRLFEKCGQCGKVRHTLLPFCESCGNRNEPAGPPANAPAS